MTAARAQAGPALVSTALVVLASILTLDSIGPELLRLGEAVASFDIERMILLHSSLPRIAVALLAGAALGLSGAILQQVLNNPLASDTTLGFSAGAKLALVLASLFAPDLIGLSRYGVAFAGAATAALLIFAITGRSGRSPLILILAGLVVSLYCGALAAALILINDRYLVSLFIWGGGSLAQQDWSAAIWLAPCLILLALPAALLGRSFKLLELGDAGASAIGIRVGPVRIAGIAVAIALAAIVVAEVGVIGFVGLVAPALARLAGARRFADRLLWSPVLGGALLWMTDQCVQRAAGDAAAFLPTGAVTALVGSPLLLLLLPRLRTRNLSDRPVENLSVRRPIGLKTLALLALSVIAAAIVVGRSPLGAWTLPSLDELAALMPLRVPRVVAAFAAGSMLAGAGVLLQRLTRNPMASPEVLGINAGATLGMTASLFLLAAPGLAMQTGFAAAGAAAILTVIYLFGRTSGFAPERVILAGIAIGALLDALIGVLSASGDPRAVQLLRWMGGSTYGTTPAAGALAAASAVFLVGLIVWMRRPLDVLSLGTTAARAAGLDAERARIAFLSLAALLSAIGAIVTGPLSFVGLMAPHIARGLGYRRGREFTIAAALAGGSLMACADWAGRMVVYPYEVPAGIAATLIGAPFLLILLRRLKT